MVRLESPSCLHVKAFTQILYDVNGSVASNSGGGSSVNKRRPDVSKQKLVHGNYVLKWLAVNSMLRSGLITFFTSVAFVTRFRM